MGEGPEYPRIMFDSIKDNPQYRNALKTMSSPDSEKAFVTWYPEFLSTIRKSSSYDDIYAHIVDFLAAEARYDDLENSQPPIINVLMNVSVFCGSALSITLSRKNRRYMLNILVSTTSHRNRTVHMLRALLTSTQEL